MPDIIVTIPEIIHTIEILKSDLDNKFLVLTKYDIGNLVKLSKIIDCVLGGCGCESEREQESPFSIKEAANHFEHKLINHRGELKSSERRALLVLIEAATKVLLNY